MDEMYEPLVSKVFPEGLRVQMMGIIPMAIEMARTRSSMYDNE